MDMQILEDLGLTKSEIKVYLQLITLGKTTSGPIIQESNLQSSVVHRCLKQLILKGLVSYVKIGKNKHYQASSPDNLLTYIDNKKQKLQSILPMLQKNFESQPDKNEVEMFLGKKAIFRMLFSLIEKGKPKDEFLSFTLMSQHQEEQIVLFYKQFNLRRQELGLDVKVLGHKDVKPIFESHYKENMLKKAKVRYSDFHFPQGLIIFLDYVILLNWDQNPSAIKITNTKMSNQFSTFFKELYEKENNAY